jgi:putative peptidoglycan lipid II flippase
LAWQLPGVQEVIRLMGPRIVTLGTIQFADLFIIRLASGLPEGSVSAYFYAFTLMQLPETLFGTAIALVMFPTLAELYNKGDMKGLKFTAVTALSIIWFFTIPSSAAVVLLGQPAISFLLEGGAFTPESTALVYSVLIFFSLRIVSEATLEIVARLFYARHNTRTPMFAYLGWLVVQVAGAYFFVNIFGVGGLALASTLAFTFLAGVLFVLNQRELGSLNEYGLWRGGARAVAATAVMSLVILLLQQLITNTLLFLVLGTAVGGITYLAVSYLLGGQELKQLWGVLRTVRTG